MKIGDLKNAHVEDLGGGLFLTACAAVFLVIAGTFAVWAASYMLARLGQPLG